jgi:hypothetical protein
MALHIDVEVSNKLATMFACRFDFANLGSMTALEVRLPEIRSLFQII